MNQLKLLVFTWIVLFFAVSCEKEKIVTNEVLIDPHLITSADTLIFNSEESKKLYLSTKPATESEFQIISSPDWIEVYPESGIIEGDISELTITSNMSGMQPGTFHDELIIMSTVGYDTVRIIGVLGEQVLYSIPDSIKFSVFSEHEKLIIQNRGNISLNFSLSTLDSYIDFQTHTGDVLAGEQKEILVNLNRESLQTGSSISEIYLSINEVIDTILVKIESFQENKLYLTTDVIDAEFSKQLDKLFYISSDPLSLSIFDTKDKTIEQISLTYIPTCISISMDGTKAVVGHDGKISYVDLANKNVLKTIDVPCYVVDVAIGNNNWAYAVPKDGSHVRVQCINLTDYTVIEHLGNRTVSDGSKIKLHPSGNSIYLADNGVSPSDLDKLDISSDTAKYLYDSPYHGDYAINGDLWFSEDGKRIFTRGKSVFKTSIIREQDMLYNGKITLESNSSNNYERIIWLDHLETKKNLYLLSSADDYWDDANKPYVYIYNSDNLTFKNKIELEEYLVSDNIGGGDFYPAEPYFVFSKSNGAEIYAITKAVGSGLLNEWAIQTINADQ